MITALVTNNFSCQPWAVPFRGEGGVEIKPGETVVVENWSKIAAAERTRLWLFLGLLTAKPVTRH